MSDFKALFAACMDRPLDETPRLVMADYCADAMGWAADAERDEWASLEQVLRLRVALNRGEYTHANDWMNAKNTELVLRRRKWVWDKFEVLANPLEFVWHLQPPRRRRMTFSVTQEDIFTDRTADMLGQAYLSGLASARLRDYTKPLKARMNVWQMFPMHERDGFRINMEIHNVCARITQEELAPRPYYAADGEFIEQWDVDRRRVSPTYWFRCVTVTDIQLPTQIGRREETPMFRVDAIGSDPYIIEQL